MKIMVVMGTRPEGIKMAPLIRYMQEDQDIRCVTVNTAQHREMLDQVLQIFNLTPEYDLGLIAATEQNRRNLLQEHVPDSENAVVGNTVIDALYHVTSLPVTFPSELRKLLKKGKKLILLTTHRRENLDRLDHVYQGLKRSMSEEKDVHVVFSIHKNPRVRKEVQKYLPGLANVTLLEPLDYLIFSHLMKRVYLIVTDSGGIQEEAAALGIPLLITRETTERPEGV